ncbi:MAG: hypothetical protein LC102_06460 [Ignavibacteriales bacterium]|nr:hypothetical protein [Ignavibacteria bacterium]MBZ0195987.1 hypothetical protein [Ignavibacteriaceae bacterium]MCZ2143050.1 hypothetical protein [Ignavibacteriales bacterium]WKZ71806.1 MAG: hypothetical protein QY308_09260 [Ignavibacteriaceae bacterium]
MGKTHPSGGKFPRYSTSRSTSGATSAAQARTAPLRQRTLSHPKPPLPPSIVK